jgi:predicted O-methyltransferase YrrM
VREQGVVRQFLDRFPYISSLRRQVREQGLFEAGHYHSPIPAKVEVISNLKRTQTHISLPEVDLRREAQFALLEPYAEYYKEISFPEEKSQQYRYYFNQVMFCYADAIFLYCFIRHFRPKRIIEIGSGFSSAVMLDTLERFPYGNVDVTFIEPSPERLLATLKAKDKQSVNIIGTKVQEIDLDLFGSIHAGDLLFVDSSHVFKYGSDVQRIFCEILPILPVGSFVHFHDIFFPFEYPPEWLAEGRYWNEGYFLRLFLAYNESWNIVFFNNYAGAEFKKDLEKKMPLCLKNIGASIYLKRTK